MELEAWFDEDPIFDVRHSDLRVRLRATIEPFDRAYFQGHVRAGTFPDELWETLGSHGLLGQHVPTQFGGAGRGVAEAMVVLEELSRVGCPLRFYIVNSIVGATLLSHHGTDDMRQNLLPQLLAGASKIAFAMTEAGAGTNTRSVTTRAERTESGWVITGTKRWVTGFDISSAMVVVARTSDAAPGATSALTLFLVDTGASGVSSQLIDSSLASPEREFDLVLDQVAVPSDAVIGEIDHGFSALFAGLNPERLAAAAMANGMTMFALRRAADRARTRVVWDKPIGSHQGVAHPLAESYIRLQSARLMTDRAADLIDEGQDAGQASNSAKFLAAENCLATLDHSMQVLGGDGLDLAEGLADLWFIARLLKVAPVSAEMVLNHTAQQVLGLPRSY